LQHPAAEISADRAGADHENTHEYFSIFTVMRGLVPGIHAFLATWNR
jgi:hypothetical protein